jgi:hypothetical protein
VSEEQSFSAVGEYFGELTELMGASKDSKRVAGLIAGRLSSEYSKDIMASLVEMEGLHKEICQILDDFSGRHVGLGKYLTVDHLILLIKFYVVQWSTMTDMVASIINKAFNLGISEKDVRFGLVLRNKPVQQSDVAKAFKMHSKEIEHKLFNQHRNEIVHRGRIMDTYVLELKTEWNRLYSSKYSILAEKSITDGEYRTASTALNKKTFDLAAERQTYYRKHYENTLKLVGEILRALAHKTIDLYQKNAI